VQPQTSNNISRELYSKRDFKYLTNDDEYEYPAGERLQWRFRAFDKGVILDKYWTTECSKCSAKKHCTRGEYRRVALME